MTAFPVRMLLLPVAAGFLTLSGCGTYRNATAYFNTYYNAGQLFDQAVDEVMKVPQPARDSNYFAPFKVNQAIIAKFEKVIEKGSRVIQFHGESGYVEDAIMMIGKAYLYQNETESAAGKFRELLDNFPSSDQRAEARLWYAKALYQGKNDEEALLAAGEFGAAGSTGDEEEVSGDILLEITMLEAQIHADRGEYARAAEALQKIGEIDGDGELKAIAQYQLGAVYETMEEYPRAAAAFGLVREFSPSPALNFNARLREGVMLSLSGRTEEALETFDEIIAWPLKPDQSALVDLEIANAYWNRGDSAAAFTLYDIIDSTYKRTDAAARSYYRRGEIFELHYRNLTGARKFFEKAKGEFPGSAVTLPAIARFTSLDHYVKTSDLLAKDDSTLRAMLNPDTGAVGSDSALGSAGAQDSLLDAAAIADDPTADPVAQDPGQERERRGPPPTLNSDNVSMRIIRSRPRHLVPDPGDPDDAALTEGDGGPPEDPESAIAGKMGEDGVKKAPPKGAPAAAKPVASLTAAELADRIAASRFELGGIFLLDLGLPDSALHYYSTVVRESPASPLVPKAIYAISEIRKLSADSASVDSLYDILLADFSETEYAEQVRRTRGMDTTVVTETEEARRYREAELLLFGEHPDHGLALANLKELAAESRDTLISPKAYYAIGWVYENSSIDLDSADAWYTRLIREYPASVYAAGAEPRVAVRADTSKLKQYVKFKEIKPIPKPQKKLVGKIAADPASGRGSAPPPPGEVGKQPVDPDDDEYYNPGEDEDEDPDAGAVDPDEDEDDPGDDDDDPGSAAGNPVLRPGTGGSLP